MTTSPARKATLLKASKWLPSPYLQRRGNCLGKSGGDAFSRLQVNSARRKRMNKVCEIAQKRTLRTLKSTAEERIRVIRNIMELLILFLLILSSLEIGTFAPTINLGTADNFALLGASGITNHA
jgi:hypothetical protein